MIPKSLPLDAIRGWIPVSRLREARATNWSFRGIAAAGEGRSKKIVRKQEAKAKW